MKQIPERIFLQMFGDEDPELGLPPDWWEVTWCIDQINDSDIEYVLASKYEELEKRIKSLHLQRDELYMRVKQDEEK